MLPCLSRCLPRLATRHAYALLLSLAATAQATEVPNVDWPLHGNDWGEQRYSQLTQINRDDVDQLGLDWFFDVYTNRGMEATPLVVDGVMYVSGSWSMVYALDARTGQLKWFYDPQVPREFLAKGCCDAVNRGVAYHEGKVFVGTYDGRLVALNAATGKVLWDVQTTDRDKPYTISGAPRIAKDKIIIGNGGAELGVRGYVTAYDMDTGKQAWRFYTVPGNPADGFESPLMEKIAKTWKGEWWKWGGGGTVWDSMVYDPELDLLYIGVGNGSPWNQNLRSPGGGDNLFLTSIVALRPETGEYVWHYQTAPGESWDYTATQHMILADLQLDGKLRKVLMQAPKNGFFYVLDRSSGELISAQNYTPVNWASGIDMQTGRPIEIPKARDFDNPQPVLPGNGGAHNWPPMSYNPQTGLVYIPETSDPVTYHAPINKLDSQPGQGKWNLGFNTEAMAPPPLPNLDEIIAQTYVGKLVAWDPVKQQARWTHEYGRIAFSGTLSTAGMLVFQGDMYGQLHAFEAANGKLLWTAETQNPVMAPPISYAIDGEQYIAVVVGLGGGLAAEGGLLANAWKVRNKSRVLAFKLGGKQVLPTPEPDLRSMPKPLAVTASPAVVAEGKLIYQRHCRYCHGDSLHTGGVNPDLRWSLPATHDNWQAIVIGGMLQPLGMVSFKEYISPEQAEAIRQYVLSEANRAYQQQPAPSAPAKP